MRLRNILILLILLLAAACAPAEPDLPEGVTSVNPPKAVGEFTLTNQRGEPVSLADLRGKAVYLAFGYTHCPDVCPITLAHMRRVHELLGDDGSEVSVAFISVDGARDTPERLMGYLAHFNPDFIGLTGDSTTVEQVIGEFNGMFVINDMGGLRENYTVDHTASSFLLDADGNWRRTYAYNLSSDVIAEDIRRVLHG